MDYKKKGDEELDLVKDDALRVFKRYNHWSYVSFLSSLVFHILTRESTQAVKEEGGDRGWVPVGLSDVLSSPRPTYTTIQSWFIGKVSNTPATPSSGVPPNLINSSMDESNGGSQVSPMSSAFPPVPNRTTTGI
jgi:bZIP factor